MKGLALDGNKFATINTRQLTSIALLTIWISLTAYGFWYFQFRYYTSWVTFDGGNLLLAPEDQDQSILRNGKLSIVHFVDTDCPCTRFSLEHIKDIETKYSDETTNHYKLSSDLSTSYKDLDWLRERIPASPSVAVWEASGKLIYFGPYSSGVLCGQGEDLLAKVLGPQSLQGQWTHQEAVGCFCPWPQTST